MKSLKLHLEDYLRLRRQLGYKMAEAEFLLGSFVRFAEENSASHISTKLALRWAVRPHIQRPQCAARLGMVRRFATYVSAHDARTEIPAEKLLPYRFSRRDPWHCTEAEVLRLIQKAEQIAPADKIKGPTLGTLVGLLAITGMRVSEALALEREAVDWKQGLLTLRRTKGNKARLVPLHPSAVQALRRYAAIRDELYPQPAHPSFFVWEEGSRLAYNTVNRWFLLVACQIGLRRPGDRRGPRIHDLRHYFAVRALLNWYRAGADVEARLPELATYLGHVHARETYWYLSAVPELLQLATLRWERAGKGGK